MPALRFRVDGKHFHENGARDNHVISLPEFLFKHKSKMTDDQVAFLNSSGVEWTKPKK